MDQYRPTTLRPSAKADDGPPVYKLRLKRPKPKQDSPPKPPKPPQRRKLSWGTILDIQLLSLLFAVLIIIGSTLLIAYHHYNQDLPTVASLLSYHPKTVSYVYSDDGRIIGEFFKEHRLVVSIDKVPKHVINAFLAAEDANFFNHPGIDLAGIIRAFIKNREAGRIVQGGSTITQQVIRTFLLSNERSYRRKIREAILAYRIEQNLTKEQILYLYLNQIYLGRGAYGVQSASLIFFGKNVWEIDLAEAAILACMVKAPSRLSPEDNLDRLKERQAYVIHRMLSLGLIDPGEADAALAQKIKWADERPDYFNEQVPYFTDHVRRILADMYGPDRLYEDGLRIYTTVNIENQISGRKAVWRGLSELTARQTGYKGPIRRLTAAEAEEFINTPPKPNPAGLPVKVLVMGLDKSGRRLKVFAQGRNGWIEYDDFKWALSGRSMTGVFSVGDVVWAWPLPETEGQDARKYLLGPTPVAQAALVLMENETGRIKAMVGGRHFQESQFNRVIQAMRQPGSAFKPFVYAAAVDLGYSPTDVIYDEPVTYMDNRGRTWTPKNYDHNYLGPVCLYTALIKSRNIVAVKLLENVGTTAVIKRARAMGITAKLTPYLSLALGSSEVPLLEMVSAYSTFPNLGEPAKPLFINWIEDRNGKLLEEFLPERRQALPASTAYVVLDMLKGVVERGTGHLVAALGRPVGGKTGTSNDQADAWFIGFTPEYSAGVWVGKDKRRKLGRKEQGGRTAAPVFLYFMQSVLKDKPVKDFTRPPGVACREIDINTHTYYTQYYNLDPEQIDDFMYEPILVEACFRIDRGSLQQYASFTEPGYEIYSGGSNVTLVYRNGKFYKIAKEEGSEETRWRRVPTDYDEYYQDRPEPVGPDPDQYHRAGEEMVYPQGIDPGRPAGPPVITGPPRQNYSVEGLPSISMPPPEAEEEY